jgi:phosphate transport system permease protein
MNDPSSNNPPPPVIEPQPLKKLIARRKFVDMLFGLLGVFLVIASLSVLVMLFGQLVADGGRRIGATHEVKADGFAPGRKDVGGTLKKVDAAGGQVSWMLVRDALTIEPDSLPKTTKLDDLVGKKVTVSATLPEAGTFSVEPTEVKPIQQFGDRFSRDEIEGTLERRKGEFVLVQPETPVDLSKVEGDVGALAGARVAMDVGRSKSFPLVARTVERLTPQGFFSSMPSRNAARAGIKSPLVGSILVVGLTMLVALPLGVAAGIYMEEYGRKNWLTAIIEINIANLAGVPSIIWGLMALGLFVYAFGFERDIRTAGMTLGLLVLPIVIMATREAIRAIPQSIREASYGCGASKWQTVRYHIIPYSMSGILTGAIISLSRAIGETAPLITIGALTYVTFLPEFKWSSPLEWVKSEYTVLPIQMFNWISRPEKKFHENAAAAGMVLLALTLSMNAVAIVLRYRLRKSIKW